MRALRILMATTTVLAGLAVAGRAGAVVAYFSETAPASADYAGTGAQPLVGDFDGDHRSDVFLYRPGAGAEVLKKGRSNRTFTTVTTGITVAGTFRPIVGDFDGNKVDDIFWYAPGTAADRLWLFAAGGGHTSIAETVNGTFTPIVGDFVTSDNGDRTDIFWYAPGTGADYLWRSSGHGGAFASIRKTVDGTYPTPIVGAFTPDVANGGSTDEQLDIFWYGNTSGSPDRLWKGDGNGGFTSKAYSAPDEARPVVGFFDGFGVQDILWNRPGGTDSVWLADPDTGNLTPHTADVGGDVRALVVQYRVVPEAIYFWSATGTDALWDFKGAPGALQYDDGPQNNTDLGAGYQPVTGDFDFDGSTDIYWIKPGAGTEKVWYGPNPDA
ncbi:hypothetical protein BH10ACT1_BH10ACT1_34480 [soil metagenome]